MIITYIAEIDDEIIDIGDLINELDATVELATDCNVVRSRLETEYEVCVNGEWEEDEDE